MWIRSQSHSSCFIMLSPFQRWLSISTNISIKSQYTMLFFSFLGWPKRFTTPSCRCATWIRSVCLILLLAEMNVCFDASEFELGRLGWHFPLAILVLLRSKSVAESSLGLSSTFLTHIDVVVSAKIGHKVIKFVAKRLRWVLVLSATSAAANWIALRAQSYISFGTNILV